MYFYVLKGSIYSLFRSGRESYGDNAIGYVQVRREVNLCTVKAKVTPEHSIHKKAYNVSLVCNEIEEQILSVSCDDCAASQGRLLVCILTPYDQSPNPVCHTNWYLGNI